MKAIEKLETGSLKSQRQFWTKSTEFKGNKVYQRNDLIDPHQIHPTGETNLQLMKRGNAPFGGDGEKINLHHMLQSEGGPIAEMTQTFHQKYSKIIHINNPKNIKSGINRLDFKNWKKNYWKMRAKDFE